MTVTELIQVLSGIDGGMVVQVGGNDLETITPVEWSHEEQAANGGCLRNMVMLEAN